MENVIILRQKEKVLTEINNEIDIMTNKRKTKRCEGIFVIPHILFFYNIVINK